MCVTDVRVILIHSRMWSVVQLFAFLWLFLWARAPLPWGARWNPGCCYFCIALFAPFSRDGDIHSLPIMPYRYSLYRGFAGQMSTADLFIPIQEVRPITYSLHAKSPGRSGTAFAGQHLQAKAPYLLRVLSTGSWSVPRWDWADRIDCHLFQIITPCPVVALWELVPECRLWSWWGRYKQRRKKQMLVVWWSLSQRVRYSRRWTDGLLPIRGEKISYPTCSNTWEPSIMRPRIGLFRNFDFFKTLDRQEELDNPHPRLWLKMKVQMEKIIWPKMMSRMMKKWQMAMRSCRPPWRYQDRPDKEEEDAVNLQFLFLEPSEEKWI